MRNFSGEHYEVQFSNTNKKEKEKLKNSFANYLIAQEYSV